MTTFTNILHFEFSISPLSNLEVRIKLKKMTKVNPMHTFVAFPAVSSKASSFKSAGFAVQISLPYS